MEVMHLAVHRHWNRGGRLLHRYRRRGREGGEQAATNLLQRRRCHAHRRLMGSAGQLQLGGRRGGGAHESGGAVHGTGGEAGGDWFGGE